MEGGALLVMFVLCDKPWSSCSQHFTETLHSTMNRICIAMGILTISQVFQERITEFLTSCLKASKMSYYALRKLSELLTF